MSIDQGFSLHFVDGRLTFMKTKAFAQIYYISEAFALRSPLEARQYLQVLTKIAVGAMQVYQMQCQLEIGQFLHPESQKQLMLAVS